MDDAAFSLKMLCGAGACPKLNSFFFSEIRMTSSSQALDADP